MKRKLTCEKCGEKKLVKDFATDKRRKSGISKYCQVCYDEMKREKREGKKGEVESPEEHFKETLRKYEKQSIAIKHQMTAVCPHCQKNIYVGLKELLLTISKSLQSIPE